MTCSRIVKYFLSLSQSVTSYNYIYYQPSETMSYLDLVVFIFAISDEIQGLSTSESCEQGNTAALCPHLLLNREEKHKLKQSKYENKSLHGSGVWMSCRQQRMCFFVAFLQIYATAIPIQAISQCVTAGHAFIYH